MHRHEGSSKRTWQDNKIAGMAMNTKDIKQFLASSTRGRMGMSTECKERWPDIDASNPKNWKRLAKFKVGAANINEDWEFIQTTFQNPDIQSDFNITDDCIIRIFYLEGSDHSTWAIVTNKDDTAIVWCEDCGD